jgi:predicted anti-sigma-YlaC factor YlaD
MKKTRVIPYLFLLIWLCAGCSIRKIALNKVAGALSAEGGTVFTGDDDPELVADAIPFALKMYESLLEALPENQDLCIATGKTFCMYSYAFIQSAADTMSDMQIDAKQAKLKRAKKMYLRAKGYLFRAWDLRYPSFRALIDSNKTDSAMALATLADTTLLYWTAASWMGAFTADKFDMALAVDMMKPVAFMERLLELKEDYSDGAAHEFFISYYGSMPESMGGSEEKSRKHFARALELSNGAKAGPYVSLATSVCVAKQYADEFKALLDSALAVDIDASPSNRLANILSQRKAEWLLVNIDNFFLIDEPEAEEAIEEEAEEE